MAGKWLTPETIPTTTRCRVLIIPDDINIYAAVSGALLPLVYVHSWEQFGAVTPAEMAFAMLDMYVDFLNSDCEGFANVETYLYGHVENQNVGGGTVTAGAENKVPYNTTYFASPDANVSRASSVFTLQPGIYTVRAWHTLRFTGDSYLQIEQVTGSEIPTLFGGQDILGTSLMRPLEINYAFLLTTVNSFKVRAITTATLATVGFGQPINESGHSEIYGELLIHRYRNAT